MSGIINQIENGNNELTPVTEDDFLNAMKLLLQTNSNSKPFIFLTGIGGLLNYNFKIFGRCKLPRKLKKSIYFTHKLRKQHITQYYK